MDLTSPAASVRRTVGRRQGVSRESKGREKGEGEMNERRASISAQQELIP